MSCITTILGPTRLNNFSFHYDNFYNDIPPFPQDAPTTNPQLNLTNELIFPDLADGANFNLPQSTSLSRYQFRDAFTWILGTHTLRLGGEFQHYNAHGLINVFGSGTVILAADFPFADLNGDGKVNDLDIPIAVAIKSSAPVVPVPIPTVSTAMLPATFRTIGAPHEVSPLISVSVGSTTPISLELQAPTSHAQALHRSPRNHAPGWQMLSTSGSSRTRKTSVRASTSSGIPTVQAAQSFAAAMASTTIASSSKQALKNSCRTTARSL